MSAVSSDLRPRSRLRRVSWATASLVVVASGGCLTGASGLEPPLDKLYFPTGLAVSPGGTVLYVTNSDFDLQYNGGTVLALNLPAIRARVTSIADRLEAGDGATKACDGATNDNPELHPGPCAPVALNVCQSATIGAFASGALLVTRPDQPSGRLFVPVRGDPSITYFDVPDDSASAGEAPGCGSALFNLPCGDRGTNGRCNADHKIGNDTGESQRGLTLQPEPFGIAATLLPGADALVVAHQSPSGASLLVNPWESGGKPTLEFYTSQLPSGATEVASLPVPAYVTLARDEPSVAAPRGDVPFGYQPGFLVTFRNAAEIELLRYNDDTGANPPRQFISRASAIGIRVNSVGDDSRGIAIDPSQRLACEASCAKTDAACLRACVDVPLRLYIANRSPASLLVGHIDTHLTQTKIGDALVDTGAFDVTTIDDTVALAFGASKIALGNVIDERGLPSLRVFTAAFDSRFVFSYDPEARRIDAVIRTGRGPHALAFDTAPVDKTTGTIAHSYLYVGHFTDSYLGVVDLDMRRPQTFGSMIATVGEPAPPRESK